MIDRNVLQQRIDELAGVRRAGANIGRAAVRLDDLNSLLRIQTALKSEKATSTVTVDLFNALVDDVQMLHTRLLGLAEAMRTRRGR